jgi:hypothetical protein
MKKTLSAVSSGISGQTLRNKIFTTHNRPSMQEPVGGAEKSTSFAQATIPGSGFIARVWADSFQHTLAGRCMQFGDL